MSDKDQYRIDSHKLIYHPQRLSAWLEKENISPIYMEIALFGGCNHRCIFCALDYLKYKPNVLNTKRLREVIREAAGSGIKSIMYAGEGEPLLHKDAGRIIEFTKKKGIDTAVTSNGVMFNKELAKICLPYLSWFRMSLNAASPAGYARIHRTRENDFHTVLTNLAEAVKIRNKSKYKCVIGAQFLLIKENHLEAAKLAPLLRDIGLDYLIIKPYSQHPLSGVCLDREFKYESFRNLDSKLRRYETDTFKIIYRDDTMKRIDNSRDYNHCLGLPFWVYLSAAGELYACSAFLGKKEFYYGNIYKQAFNDIINGRRRKNILRIASSKLDVSSCREVCRLDKINSYLWKLKNPPDHVNFI